MQVLVPLVTSLVSVRSWWRCWVACLMRMILHTRPRCVSSPAPCPEKPSFGIPTRDERWHWSSSACLSLQDPWLRASPASASGRLILSSAAASRAAPIESPFNTLLACFTVRLLSLLASPQIPASTFAETPLLEVCPRYCVFHQHLSWVSVHHLSGSLHFAITIWGPGSGPHLEYAVSVPSLRLGHSPNVRRPCVDYQSLLGDNHCL